MKKLLGLLLLFVVLLVPALVRASASPATAPLCSSSVNAPVIASYETGTHWIAGENSLREGSDVVYQLDNGNVLQCFCPVDKSQSGVQTYWNNAANMLPEVIASHVSQGWIYIESGADFGLDNDPYIAYNQSSSCSAPVTASSAPISAPISTPIAENPSQAGQGGSTSSNPSGGDILGLTTPSSLPPTGSDQIVAIITTFLAAASSFGYGIYLKTKNYR